MIKKVLFLLTFLLLVSIKAQAQTVTATLEWDTTDSVAVVNSDVFGIVVDSGTAFKVVPVCISQGTGAHCTLGLANFDTSKKHTIFLSIINISGVNIQPTFNYTPGIAPAMPSGFKVTITVTIP